MPAPSRPVLTASPARFPFPGKTLMIQTLSDLQLAAYFERIGYSGLHRADADTLRALHRLHPQAIPFENIDALSGLTPRLDLDSVFSKLVLKNRGGYCYEHNLLFRAVLDSVGFETTGLAARVLWNNEQAMPPRTHMMLLVETQEQTWLADVGFGSMTLTAPLDFKTGIAQRTPHESFRLEAVDRGDYQLQVQLGDEWKPDWKPIYRFDLEPQFPADYDVANHYVSTLPSSIFLNHLIVARATVGERLTLVDRTLTRRGLLTESTELGSTAAVRDTLHALFGIALPESVDSAIGRVMH